MIPDLRPLPVLVNIHLILFAHFAFAASQNVTVDDAALVGSVIPQYLPSTSYWNVGNNCSGCLVTPDPSKAYNGTWHDTTFNPDSGISQEIEFTFVGTALYIFFILANTVPHATTLTDLDFYMDNASVGTYVHSPTASTDYQYNVPVYVNESVASGEHTVIIEPARSPGDSVLMLFDYLIYTWVHFSYLLGSFQGHVSSSTVDGMTTSPSVSPSTSAIPSTSSAPGAQSTTSRQNTAAIIGGTVGGVAGLVFVTTSLLCYRRHQRRNVKRGQLSPWHGRPMFLGSLPSLHDVPLQVTSRGFQHVAPLSGQHDTRHEADTSVTSRSPSPPISIDPPSTASLFGGSNGLRRQVEQLRAEISRLRYLQYQNRNPTDLGTKAVSASKR